MLRLDLYAEHPGRLKAKTIKTDTTSCVVIHKCDTKESPVMRLHIYQADKRALYTITNALNFAFGMGNADNTSDHETRGASGGPNI